MTADAAIHHWERLIAAGNLTNQELLFAAKQLQKALRNATGVTLHSTSRDGKTVENTAVAANE
jgi:hypothetical protein